MYKKYCNLFLLHKGLLTCFATCLLLTAMTACSDNGKDTKKVSRSPLYTNYISGYTAGVIKSNSAIRVRLARGTEGVEAGKKVDEELFDISPDIEGETFWEDAHTLVFKPKEKLPSNTHFAVQFALHKVRPEIPKKLENFHFDFQTVQQAYEVQLYGLETESLENSRQYKLTGVIQTADFADIDAVRQMLKASQHGTALPIDWQHENDTKHAFSIKNIVRKEEAGQIEVSWSGTPIDLDNHGNQTLAVPALGDYSVLSASLVQNSEQYLSVLFSNPISDKQELSGLVYIGGKSKEERSPRWVISKNELKIYPSQQTLQDLDEVLVRISRDVKSWEGKKLAQSFEKKIALPRMEPGIVLLANKGMIMAGKDQMVLPFKAIGLKAVDVQVVQIFEDNILQYLQVNGLGETAQLKRVGRPVRLKKIDLQAAGVTDLNAWNRFTLDLSELIDIEQGAVYQINLNFRKEYSLYFCPGASAADELQSTEQDWSGEEEESSYWDSYEDDEDYDWSQRNNPCHLAYYGKRREQSKLVFASELGLIAKRGEQGDLVTFVTNVKTSRPLEGVTITAYDYQQQPVGSVKSAGNGMASIPLTGKPFALVARSGKEFGYLKLDDGSSLSMSNFDVGGEQVQQGIKGFIYGERGVWRPGDTLYLDFMLEDRHKVLPPEHPVVMELYTPHGQLHSRYVSQHSHGGVHAFLLHTPEDAPTGNWSARVKVGSATFSKTVKIETVKPNRLKVKLDFGREFLTSAQKEITGSLFSQWLHGAKAGNLKAVVDMSVAPATTTFKGYPAYSFDDPSKDFSFSSEEVFSGRLDSEGKAVVNVRSETDKNAPGMLKAVFKTKVFEEGGDFSIHTTSIPLYPYESFVGLKVPEGDQRNMLLTNKDHTIQIAAVDAAGRPLNRSGVKVKLYKIEWKWWWDNSYEDLSNYVGSSHHRSVEEDEVEVVNGRGEWKLRVEYPSWGRYYLQVTDPVSGHSAGKIIYIDWPGWAGKGKASMGGATMLSFTTDQEVYRVGEKATLFIPSGKGGRALVSLESGSSILNAFWVETEAEKTQVSFDITREMAPNVFVHITLLQPHAHTENDLPIRMYGVSPVTVEDTETMLEPVIDMAESLSPEQPFSIKVKEQKGRPMTYTIAIVDEGILDLTSFRTPAPRESLYAREALGVKTWDMYDQVIGAYPARMERLLAIGGDDEIRGVEEKQESRFKPVVRHIGPFFLEAGEEAMHTLSLPPYIGSVRTMLVAKHEGAYGSTEKTTPVRQSLMVLPTLSRVVGPGETIALPVTVFSSEKHLGETTISIKTSGHIKVKGSSQQRIVFEDAGEKMVFFELKADQATGPAKVQVQASSAAAQSSHEIALQVRAANPVVNQTIARMLHGGESLDMEYVPLGIRGTNKATVEVSSLPPLNLEQRLQYLIQYPHGCVEQTTSGVFAQLYLHRLIKLNDQQKQQIQKNVEAGIERLKSFQVSSGGFSYWPDQGEANLWGTNYAGHFLVEAKRNGYFVPVSLLEQWTEFQTQRARQWNPEAIPPGDNALSQAYRLYTLALLEKPVIDAMNRMREHEQLTIEARWRLALAYAKIGQLEPAKQLVAGLHHEVVSENARSYQYTYGSIQRDQAMVLETLTNLNRQEEAFSLVRLLSEDLGSNDSWMSTQTTAYCLIAISEYAKHNKAEGSIDVHITAGGLNDHQQSDHFIQQIILSDADRQLPLKIRNNGQQTVFVQLIRRGVPLEGNEKASASKINMQVAYKTKDGAPLDVHQIPQGQDFMVEVTVHNPGMYGDYTELALSQIFPSGWEILNHRLTEGAHAEKQHQPEYQDIRDDRVYTYFDLRVHEKKVFRVMLNASYRGEFYLPAFAVEAMYDHSIHASTQGQWVKVQK